MVQITNESLMFSSTKMRSLTYWLNAKEFEKYNFLRRSYPFSTNNQFSNTNFIIRKSQIGIISPATRRYGIRFTEIIHLL